MSVDFDFRETSGQVTVEWVIKDFSFLPKHREYLLTSPTFLVDDAKLIIRLYPNEPMHFLIGLGRKHPTTGNHNVFYDFTFKNGDEQLCSCKQQEFGFAETFNTSPMVLIAKFGIFHSWEFSRPDFILRILCHVRTDGSLYKPDCNLELNSEPKMTKSIQTLLANMKNLFLTGQNFDVTIMVDSKEFKAHRSILAARSPVFSSMFQYDMLENTRGIMRIEDCEPEAFHSFLMYLYTGKLSEVLPENVPDVYILSAKYDVPELRRDCLQMLRHCMTVNTFCDVVVIASMYEDKELMSIVENFFFHNFKQIFRSRQWKSFLVENSVMANDLFQSVALSCSDAGIPSVR